MKIGDIQLGNLIEDDEDPLTTLIYRYNNTSKNFPKNANIGELFGHQVRETPDAIAVIDQDKRITYAELDIWSDRIAKFIQVSGLEQGDCVGAFLGRSFWLVATLLGTLKTGAVYLPLNSDLPDSRLRDIIDQTSCRLLIGVRTNVARLNSLQYECSSVKVALCLDSRDMLTEAEVESPRMSAEVWNYAASGATTAIEASGWRHGLGGLALTDAEISDYLDNIERKLEPYLGPTTRLLDVGCGAGLTMRRLAPRVGEYVGIDLSDGALAWAQRFAEQDQLTNVRFLQLGAHELASFNSAPFDVILIASVIQSFPGLNYLRQVLAASLARLDKGGIIFCSHIWNPSQRQVFIDTVGSEAANSSLFVHGDFWQDWQAHQPRIHQVEITPLKIPITHSLGGYSYDVLLHIAPSLFQLDSSNIKPLKVQADQRFLETLDGLPSPHGGSPEAPVYVIFTSGSTGRPKGVKVKTQSLINLLYWYRDLGKIGPGIRVLQVIPSSFDASIKNYLATLLFGGTLVLLPETVFDPEVLLQAIAHHQIHILNPGVPSMFYPVLELAADREYRELESLKLLALGGEAPIMARLRPWLTHPNCRTQIVNIYGPTECTDIALCYGITSADWKLDFLPPIGEPLPNLRAYILDEHNNPQPLGAMGELCLAGEGLAIGYVGDREQTAHTFVPDPFFPGQQMYRTGDLAYRRTDGAVVYAGRRDNQLKIRGVRIELEEIEARLRTYPGVREAAVVALPDGEGMLELIGYIDASSVKVPSLDLLREWLAAELPAPMVPAHIYLLEEFPRNPNGKIDRRRLPSPKQIAAASDSHQLPQLPSTTTEQTLLAIWREVLSHPNLGVHDNFFDAGGHSLKTAVMASRIRQTLGVSFSVSQVYEAQTIVAQAKLIEAERTRNGEFQSNIVRLLNHKGYPLLFCFPPISANAWSFLDLAQELASTYSVYAFDFLLATDRIQQYAEAIRAITGNQSFALIGYSAGASLAFSVTQHLEAEGVPVANLLILDSIWRTVSPAYSEAYIEQIVTYYLENPRFRDLFTESVAQQFWAERIRAFARVYGSEQDTGTIAAPITLIAAAEGSDSSNIEGWQIASRHSFQQIQGVGHHDCLLERPHVVTNAALIHNIINISFKEVQS